MKLWINGAHFIDISTYRSMNREQGSDGWNPWILARRKGRVLLLNCGLCHTGKLDILLVKAKGDVGEGI